MNLNSNISIGFKPNDLKNFLIKPSEFFQIVRCYFRVLTRPLSTSLEPLRKEEHKNSGKNPTSESTSPS